jgi:hypothetical protein
MKRAYLEWSPFSFSNETPVGLLFFFGVIFGQLVPPASEAAGSGELQLVGFTTTTTTGDAGILNLSRMCAQEFKNSRICTTEEVVRSVDPPPPPASPGPTAAWVHATFRSSLVFPAAQGDANEGSLYVFDPTGGTRETRVSATCDGWTDSTTNGTVVRFDPYGEIADTECDQSLRVSCCAAVGK